jgi:hypothetical protein
MASSRNSGTVAANRKIENGSGAIRWTNGIMPLASAIQQPWAGRGVRAMELNDTSYKFIIQWEVGGGEPYYNRFCATPTWPGGDSGITIGVGYDLGQIPAADFQSQWGPRLDPTVLSRLQTTIGLQAASAQAALAPLRDIVIPWEIAEAVYREVTVPNTCTLTEGAFPGVDQLAPNAQGALVSLVFNRGTRMTGPSRTEMAAIRTLVPQKDYEGIAEQLESMKRLWPDTKGLQDRRDAEAALVRSAIGQA